MDNLIDSQHGIGMLLATVVIFLGLHFILNTAKLVISLLKEKSDGSNQHLTKLDLTLAQVNDSVRDLRIQLGILERELGEVHKFKSDTQKIFSAIKFMAGEDWPRIRKALEEDGLPK
jgi:hypothetical protein